jgi:hypothetical protein
LIDGRLVMERDLTVKRSERTLFLARIACPGQSASWETIRIGQTHGNR